MGWQEYLHDRFPAYLLPGGMREQMSVEAAEAFLARLSRRPGTLLELRRMAFLAAYGARVEAFVESHLPALMRVLPSRTRVEQRRWEGGFRGRLAVLPTVREHLLGHKGRYVTQIRRRTYDLPENILVRHVSATLLQILDGLGATSFATGHKAFRRVAGLQGPLRRLLLGTILDEVPEEKPTAMHEAAAHMARHETFEKTLELHRALTDALHTTDPRRVARLLADGALLPADEPTRFELAVLIRTVEGLEATHQAEDSRWKTDFTTIDSGREEVARLRHPDGREVRVYYNQAVFPSGLREQTVKHYLDRDGRLRPDISVVWSRGGEHVDACVFEVKLTQDPGYVTQGIGEAIVYAHEYASRLRTTPHAVVVTTAPVVGTPREGDRVIALDWAGISGGRLERAALLPRYS